MFQVPYLSRMCRPVKGPPAKIVLNLLVLDGAPNLPVPRPRSGLSRSDFVPWHDSGFPACPLLRRCQGDSALTQRPAPPLSPGLRAAAVVSVQRQRAGA
jgi:hypothetical protein